jgi:zinc/manganese transport system permease protein
MSTVLEFMVMQTVLVMVVLILHTYIGLHIIRRGIIFCDLVLDQLAAFGVMVGIAIGVGYGSPASYLFSFAAVLIGSILLVAIQPKDKSIPQEAVIGILYGMALTLSLLLADKTPEGGTNLGKTLVGSMLWVSWPLIGTTVGVYCLLLIFHFVFRRQIIALAENRTGLPLSAWWDFLFFLTQGVITILIVPVAGVLLAYGFLMIPAGIGTLFTRSWGKALAIGWTTGTATCLLGILGSYHFDLPYGPSLLLTMGIAFLVAMGIRGIGPWRQKTTRNGSENPASAWDIQDAKNLMGVTQDAR